MAQYSDFPSNEYSTRCRKAQELMGSRNLDALLLAGTENLAYFGGFRKTTLSKRGGYFFILPRDGAPMLILPNNERNAAKEMSWLYSDGIRFFQGGWGDPSKEDANQVVLETVKKLGVENGKLGLELGEQGLPMWVDMSLAEYGDIRRKLSKAKIVDAGDLIWELRMIKSSREIACVKEACEITCEAIRVAFESMQEGMTEVELAKIVYSEMIKRGGADDPLKAFVHLRSGPKRCLTTNPRPRSNRILRGDVVVFDGGALYKGYFADMIRLACIKPSKKQLELFDIAVKACEKGVELLVAGTRIRDVVLNALEVIHKAGYGKNVRRTVVGHGIGLDVHEPPILDLPYGDSIIQEGMTLAMEPVFRNDEWYFLQEDNIIVTKKGPENLTPLEKKLQW